jgi:IS30 family transposase
MTTLKMLKSVYDNYLNPTHPTAYSGINNVHRFYGGLYSRKAIADTLARVDSYTLHREYKRPSVHNPYFVYSLRDQGQLDLIDMQQLAKHNDDVRFLSVLIDSFSRKLFVKKLLFKTKESSLAAIKEMMEEIQPKFRSVLFDKGTEYTNSLVRTYLNKEGIKIYHPASPVKAGLVSPLH